MSGRLMVLQLTAGSAAHLHSAVRLYRERCRSNGMVVPPELEELLPALAFSAMRGQEGTQLDELWDVVQGPVVQRRMLNYQDVAGALAISVRSVRRLIATERLPAVQVSPGTSRVLVEDLDQFIADLKNGDHNDSEQ